MSKPVTLSIPHELGVAEARSRIDAGLSRMVGQFGKGGLAKVDQRWDGDRLLFTVQAMGQVVTGHLTVLERAIDMELNLPGLLGALAGRIKGRVKSEGQLLLGKD